MYPNQKGCEMKLIAESGSTRTEWALVEDNHLVQRVFTEGLNPFFQTRREISRSVRLGLPESFFKKKLDQVYYYGAGCSSYEKKNILGASLVAQFKTPNISKNERSAASNRWRHAANIKHGLAIIAFVACILPASNLCGQNIAIKSNLLYDLTTTLNMGGEVRCDDTHTISLSLNYNPWNFGGNKKMKHFLLQPEYRKWFNEVFTGSFIGFQLHYALFNFGGMLPWGFNNGKMLGIENRQIAHNRYQGNLAGFGISYGYQWIISPQWNLEAGISLGYAHLNYKRYGQSEGAALLEKSSCNYWGPTQAGISIIYFIR